MNKNINDRDIAIIGMACRFPDANNYGEFWSNLIQGKNSITHFTQEELLKKGRELQTINSPNFVKASAILKDIDKFDALFFNCTHHEAVMMDPQFRIFLECAWEALEDSGYASGDNNHKIGIYAGSYVSYYLYRHIIHKIHESIDKEDVSYDLYKCINDYITTFVAYKLNLKGPSVNVQTWCTSSITAIHLGCQSLRNNECDIVLSGGVNLHIPQEGYFITEDGLLSSDGSSKPFDKNAKGTVPGNGVGIVVLKLLSKAIDDHDHIHAIIKGTSVNNDGYGPQKLSYHGLTTEGQYRAINDAFLDSNIDANSVSHIEVAGNANNLADRIELNALGKYFEINTKRKNYCAITSVKSNIGHLGTASGIAGLIKVALSLKNKKIPGIINFNSVDKKTLKEDSPFYINSSLIDWESNNSPRRAAVNNFGLGGTNAHVVLEEAPETTTTQDNDTLEILTLSAKTPETLEKIKQNLINDLINNPEKKLTNVAYTLNIGRKALECRQAVICNNSNFIELLGSKKADFTTLNDEKESSIIFLFSASEEYSENITFELYNNSQIFKNEIDYCFNLTNQLYNIDIKNVLYCGSKNVGKSKLKTTLINLFVEYALAKVWISWGVQPKLMIGCSIGELVAACIAEVISIEDAIKLIVELFSQFDLLPHGQMLTVLCSKDEMNDCLNDDISIAAVYNPSTLLLSGTTDAIQRTMVSLKNKNIIYQLIESGYPFHHPKSFDPLRSQISSIVSAFNISSPKIPYISCITKNEISFDTLKKPEYWLQIFSDKFDFDNSIQLISKINTNKIYLEIGLKQSLFYMLKQHPSLSDNDLLFYSLLSSEAKVPELESLYSTLGGLWQNGVNINWKSFYNDEKRNRIPLPTYPFERKRFWYDIEHIKEKKKTINSETLTKNKVSDWFYSPAWSQNYQYFGNIQNELLETKKTWMIFLDNQNVGISLVEKLKKYGQSVLTIKQGDSYSQVGTTEFLINPSEKSDYQQLFGRLVELNLMPDKIIHLWNFTMDRNNSENKDIISNYAEYYFINLIYLVQAIGEIKKVTEIHLFVMTDNLFMIHGNEEIYPEKSVILGPVKTIHKEYKNIKCSCIEISSNQLDDNLIESLLKDLLNAPNENCIAYRGIQRWKQTNEKINLISTNTNTNLLRENGNYLITGGLGGVGLVFSEFLAEKYKANLVLVSRSKFPDRIDWNNYIQKEDANPNTVYAIKKIIELETKFAITILVCRADVSDFNELSAVSDFCREKIGHINGIIHNAAVQGGGSIQFKTKDKIKEVFAPKIQGTENLFNLFKHNDLDFMILSSSNASVLGLYGLVDYCSANAYVDAFAQKNFTNSRTLITAVNWDMWSEVGMGISSELPVDIKTLRDVNREFGIKSEEGIEVLKQVLTLKLPQSIISTRELSELNRTKLFGNIWTESDESTLTADGQLSSMGVVHTDFENNEIEHLLQQMWIKLFGISEISINDNFIKLGGHSLLATMLLNRIRNTFEGVEISLTELFNNPTIKEMAELIKTSLVNKAASSIPDLQFEKDKIPTLHEMEEYLRAKISLALKIDIEPHQKIEFKDIDIVSITGQLYLNFKKDLNLPIYEYEILSKKTIEELANYLIEALIILKNNKKLEGEQKSIFTDKTMIFHDDEIKTKNKSMVFVYSATRSGSTLLRLILGGNSKLFSPPEMKLLRCNTINEWYEKSPRHTILHGGVLRSFIELFNYSHKEALDYLNTLIEENKSIQDVYRIIQDKLGSNLLVDKSPEYSLSTKILSRSEKLFENPKYIFLVRHPYSVIESSVRNRTYTIHLQSVIDPYRIAEDLWFNFNNNILNFLNTINKENFIMVCYEDLVKDTRSVVTNICNFLQIEFEEAMLNPYDGKRMIDGDGDPNIFNHDYIDPKLGDTWKNIKLPIILEKHTQVLADKFNYILPNEINNAKYSEIKEDILSEEINNLSKLNDKEIEEMLKMFMKE